MSEFQGAQEVQRIPCTVSGMDAHRKPIKSYGDPEPVEILAFDPGQSSEPRTSGGDRVITTPTFYTEPGTPFTEHDECIHDGVRYEVDGRPRLWVDPETGEEEGVVVKLRRVDS